MSVTRSLTVHRLGKVLAGIVMGLSIGTLLPPEPVSLPAIGSVSGVLVGIAGLLVGTGLFLLIQRSSSACGCGEGCGC